MEITNAQYEGDEIREGNHGITATIDGQEMSIPLDSGNRHYAEILKQVAAGTITIAEAD